MCVYSMISDGYGTGVPFNPQGPDPFKQYPWTAPPTDPTNIPGETSPNTLPIPGDKWNEAAPPSLPWTPESFDLLKDILTKVEELDKKLGLINCEDPAKAAWMKKIEERLKMLENDRCIAAFKGEYRFLSNFDTTVTIEYDYAMYPSLEHAYQAAKTLDINERRKIQDCQTPGEAKRMGKTVTLRPDWENIKLHVMRDLLRKKFSVHPLREKLIQTYPMQLIEGNNWGDTYWGVCNGKGENRLGLLLMEVRDELIKEDEEK